jgi:hypothetical protein
MGRRTIMAQRPHPRETIITRLDSDFKCQVVACNEPQRVVWPGYDPGMESHLVSLWGHGTQTEVSARRLYCAVAALAHLCRRACSVCGTVLQ